MFHPLGRFRLLLYDRSEMYPALQGPKDRPQPMTNRGGSNRLPSTPFSSKDGTRESQHRRLRYLLSKRTRRRRSSLGVFSYAIDLFYNSPQGVKMFKADTEGGTI